MIDSKMYRIRKFDASYGPRLSAATLKMSLERKS